MSVATIWRCRCTFIWMFESCTLVFVDFAKENLLGCAVTASCDGIAVHTV